MSGEISASFVAIWRDPRARSAKGKGFCSAVNQLDFANTTWRTSIFPDRNPASQ
jgi:hypothetical protein